ncbi:MAG: hypothetical protein DWQ07_16495 [Chloroflexi bacterium]|nr:MAG: hypothetical protein DWQ07_16495 [Chloroflexota bacterium]MBL1195353.1 hypothetical protein [Chloroflexota bacterium]NOH12637.1 hypothetical protein [Chloroflexota bacterium]
MRQLIQNDWFWWVGSVALPVAASSLSILSVLIANDLYQKKSGKIIHLLFAIPLNSALPVGIAVGLATAYVSWRLIYRSSLPITIRSSAWAGVLAVTFSHFIFFFIWFGPDLIHTPIDIVMLFAMMVIGFPLITMMTFGWLTLPLGALFGGLLGWLYKRSRPVPEMEKAS